MFFVAAAPKLCIVLSHSIRSSTNIDILERFPLRDNERVPYV